MIGARDACLRRRLEGRTLQDILELLHQHGIARMVDGRLRPNRVSMGVAKASLDTTGMQRVPATHDIASVSLSELGNVCMGCEDWCHRDQRVLTAAGEVLTERLRALPLQACLMYAERQASACHREVIAAYLAQRGNHSEHLTSGTSLHCQSNAPLHLLVWA